MRCTACGAELPLDARYCMQCGILLLEEANPVESTEDRAEGLDLDNRILCPDGTCTGIIIDGKCSECGRPYPGKSPEEQ
jgi:hypothetical protein